MQALFSAAARIVVRELRKTETTDVIMVYSGTMHCACAFIACIALPGQLKILQHAWQVATLLVTGITPLSISACAVLTGHSVHSTAELVKKLATCMAHGHAAFDSSNPLSIPACTVLVPS